MIDDADLSEKKGEETRRRRPQDVPMLSPRFPPDVIDRNDYRKTQWTE